MSASELPLFRTITDYKLYARNGKLIRVGTMVTFEDGKVIKFLDRLPKGEASRNARREYAKELAAR